MNIMLLYVTKIKVIYKNAFWLHNIETIFVTKVYSGCARIILYDKYLNDMFYAFHPEYGRTPNTYFLWSTGWNWLSFNPSLHA